uniref:39S ribosomal protein L38, mitochondrial n=1 Tax=Panagrolaimus sp. JU765 TaxID=591449 RepID=A0AC34RA22_9BILA
MKRLRSIYAEHYIKRSHRAKATPRVNRPWRPRVIAWAGPTAFMRDRWYERDAWYKARIQKPEIVPRLHIIDADRIVETFAQRTKIEREKEIDIGFKKREVIPNISKDEQELEKLSRKKQLKINVDDLPFNQLSVYDHFNVFDDLFAPEIYFYNTQKFSIKFNSNSVERGNLLTASQATEMPEVVIESIGNDGYNTFLMVNLDGNAFTENQSDGQVLHWFKANIPDGTNEGETIVSYLPPTPFKGTGYHRIAFVLFRHKNKIDFGNIKIQDAGLSNRIFSVNKFYKENEENLTPSALNFAQVKWDESVDETLHQIGSKSPRYFYDWNEVLKPEQKEFPKKPMPFNHYLDMYRPPELVHRDMFKRKLEKLVHEGKCEAAEYPDVMYVENKKKLPRWQHLELIDENLGAGKYAALYLKDGFINAVEQVNLTEHHHQEQKKETAV